MIIEQEKDLTKLLAGLVPSGFIPARKRVLVVPPQHYRIAYAINDFMKQPDGSLQKVDADQAMIQWKSLCVKFESLGLVVEQVDPDPELPDMVYSANHGLPYWDYMEERPAVILAKMANKERSAEVNLFRHWYEKEKYIIHELSPAIARFEGMGDALVDPSRFLIWGAYGPRSERNAYSEIAELSGYSVILLELKSQIFYHLDTCLAILNSHAAVVIREAFAPESYRLIQALFPNLIEVPASGQRLLLANCFCPNGRDVVVQKGSEDFCTKLEQMGFRAHEVETSEFIKGGGSVFCMKMQVF